MDGSESFSVSVPAAQSAADASTGSRDLQMLISTFRRRMGLIIGVAVLVLSAVVIFTFQQTPATQRLPG